VIVKAEPEVMELSHEEKNASSLFGVGSDSQSRG
jgi:hypothetical protein